MVRRVAPALLALVAAVADARGAHGLAYDALLAAVPFGAVAGLSAFGDRLERGGEALLGLQSLLWALAVALLVISCAARAPATTAGTLPPLGASALAGSLAVFALKGMLAAAPWVRRLALAPAKP